MIPSKSNSIPSPYKSRKSSRLPMEIDDCSSDSSEELLESFLEDDYVVDMERSKGAWVGYCATEFGILKYII